MTSHCCVLSRKVKRTTRFGLQTSPVRFTNKSYKANQLERKSWLLVVRLLLILVRFTSLPIRTDIWRPLVASLLLENTQWKLRDMWSSKWFGLPHYRYFFNISNNGVQSSDHVRSKRHFSRRIWWTNGYQKCGYSFYNRCPYKLGTIKRMWCVAQDNERFRKRTWVGNRICIGDARRRW